MIEKSLKNSVSPIKVEKTPLKTDLRTSEAPTAAITENKTIEPAAVAPNDPLTPMNVQKPPIEAFELKPELQLDIL